MRWRMLSLQVSKAVPLEFHFGLAPGCMLVAPGKTRLLVYSQAVLQLSEREAVVVGVARAGHVLKECLGRPKGAAVFASW